MASFKLCISDPSTGKTFQKEVKDAMASPFLGLNIGEAIKGDAMELSGYEFQITGGSDYCGFPMRKGILGQRKKVTILGGIGFRGAGKGIKRRKTVCGHKIHEKISQINLKVTKPGSKKLAEIFGVQEKAEEKATTEEKQAAPEEKKAKKESAEPKSKEEPKTKEKAPVEEKQEAAEEKKAKKESAEPKKEAKEEAKAEDKKQ